MKIKYIALLILSFFFYSTSFAVDTVTIVIKKKNGGSSTRLVQSRKINENTNRIIIPASSIPENFMYLDVLADHAIATKGEDGFWIAPRGEMGTFRLGESSLKFTHNHLGQLFMPIFGMQTPRETFVAIIKGLQLEHELIVKAENGEYRFFPRWSAKIIGFKPYEDIIIDFVTLKGEAANYSGMARVYRKYQLERGVVQPFKERMKGNRALQQIATAMPHRIEPHCVIPGRHKKQDFSPETIPAVKPLLTFPEAKKFIDAFLTAGMTDVHFIDAGWQSGGYDGKCPQIFPIEECLGGGAALRDFVKYTQSLGYQICANSNHTDAYTCSYMWDPYYVLKRPDGSLFRAGGLNGGWMYYMSIKPAWELFVKRQLEQTRDLGYEGVLFIDVFTGRPPDPDFDRDHPANRKEQAEYQNKALAYAKMLFGGAASESGFDHCIQNLDYVNYLGRRMLYGEGVRKDAQGNPRVYHELIDRVVPLWELVYHGITLSNPDKFTQQYLPRNSTARLRLIEFGGRPMFYSTNYSPQMIAKYREMYDMFQPLKHLQIEFMEENRELATDVYLTRYGNREETVVNYSKEPFLYKGITVAPRDYKLFNH